MTTVDFLTEDTPIEGQGWFVASILTPHNCKTKKGDELRGLKIRGVYSTKDAAQERASYLQGIDPVHNIYIAEVGKWLPFFDDPSKATDAVYAESGLNDLMKNYMESQAKAKQLYERRKNEMIMETIKKGMNSKAATDGNDLSYEDESQSTNNNFQTNDVKIENSKHANSVIQSEIDASNLEDSLDEKKEREARILSLEEEIANAKKKLDIETIGNLRNIMGAKAKESNK